MRSAHSCILRFGPAAVMLLCIAGCVGEERPPPPPVAPSYEECSFDQCDRERRRRRDETISI
jgi:hypothetical protein